MQRGHPVNLRRVDIDAVTKRRKTVRRRSIRSAASASTRRDRRHGRSSPTAGAPARRCRSASQQSLIVPAVGKRVEVDARFFEQRQVEIGQWRRLRILDVAPP